MTGWRKQMHQSCRGHDLHLLITLPTFNSGTLMNWGGGDFKQTAPTPLNLHVCVCHFVRDG